MLITKVHRRYAKALLDFAQETGKLEEVRQDVLMVKKLLAESSDLNVVLKSPVILAGKKKEILTALFKDRTSEAMLKFMKLAVQHGREASLAESMQSFINQYRLLKGIEEAVITSATPLTPEERAQIKERLAAITSKEIEIVEKVDSSLIGGLKIKLGDRQYNGSISAQLAQLRRSFKENIFVPEF